MYTTQKLVASTFHSFLPRLFVICLLRSCACEQVDESEKAAFRKTMPIYRQ